MLHITIHQVADKACSRKPLFSLSDAYALGPGLCEFPRISVVGDWIIGLCRALRRAVAFSPYLLPAGRIKQRCDKVSSVSDDDGQLCHCVGRIPTRGQHGSSLNDPVLFRLLSVLVGVISSQRNDLADWV